jgi:phosphoglucosamine mutase
MTNKAIELALNLSGIQLHRANVGDRYVLESMLENDCLLGGEGSGHLLMLDKHSTGDGLISALQVLQSCLRFNASLSDLLRDAHLFPQCLLNAHIQPTFDWKTNAVFQAQLKAIESKLSGKGRVLIRPSGTEPVLRIMVEAEEEETARANAQALLDALTSE